MITSDIQVGQHYSAEVNGRLTVVLVDGNRGAGTNGHHNGFDVTNLATGRRLWFRQASQFRRLASSVEISTNGAEIICEQVEAEQVEAI